MKRSVSFALAAIAILGLNAPRASAQSWRTFDASRQLRDTAPMAVRLTYGAGRVSVAPQDGAMLYDMHLRYDIDRGEPLYAYNAETRRLEIGVSFRSKIHQARHHDGGELQLRLSRRTPLALNLEIGAAEADISLGGLRVQSLALQTGATDTKVRFDTPNPTQLKSLQLDGGAANISLSSLGNAHAERIKVNLGAGHVELDFRGDWANDTDLELNFAVGAVDIVVPSDVGVFVTRQSFMQSFSAPDLTKRDGSWVSDNWDTARYKLTINSSGALGRLAISRR
jgi:hypothetical protein